MKKTHYRYFLILAAFAGAIALFADFLIGFDYPDPIGRYGMVQTSWAYVASWRPILSMILASIVFPLYFPGLYVVSKRIENDAPRAARVFRVSSYVASFGCLLVHAAFCMPMFIYKYLYDTGHKVLAINTADRILDIAIPSLALTGIAMLIAFTTFFAIIIRGTKLYSRWFVLFNPIIITMITILMDRFLPPSKLTNGISMCKMNLGLFLFFVIAIVYEYKCKDILEPVA